MTYDEQKAAQQHQIIKQSSLKTLVDFYKDTDISLENLLKTCDIVTYYVENGMTPGVIKNCKVIDNLYKRNQKDSPVSDFFDQNED